MEARSLARCLRLRPTSSLPSTQPTLLRSQNVLRPFSTARRLSQAPSSNTDQPPSPPSAGSTDFDRILDQLNLNNSNSNSNSNSNTPAHEGSQGPTTAAHSAPFADPLSLSRAVSLSAETENYRQPAARRVELKLGPTLGRQVHVEPERGTDLTAALRVLQANIATNKVRAQWHGQKFHVRRGQMRKNLRMERWRKLFKFSFNKTVAKIQRMRAQGW
ncbi:mitochondrial 37S ribosomal protein bS21m [Aspergillus clavatus NRRL 1]|uniref:Ribosomal protein S21 n=1 Tax=Aspergillus clavatus (strain ATCC 1007 / CBS 513.65 / DSM 816 / NCTC 3887 / NRRL 1 / QM 1276 / 107) TaxID=344612 RepID=A1C634_ASPCL|nr:uncharacterized protein ACLA_068830 [Aspergillus clavatus NRRL 1]EAW13855.1 conserved hypothetical protein [Aspergillus clavatus NRRL 1]